MERDSIITAWESMTGKEQHDMIAACVYQVAQRGASAGRKQRPNAVRQLFHFHKGIFFVSHVRSPF